jgi:predicted nuclease of predicted toxin-antitoxin system
MKILIDMNLPPRWAREKCCIVLTHDLDFGVLHA